MMGDSLVPKVVTETVCALTGWNYVTQISEMLVVLYGIFMCIRLRGEKSVYSESKWYTVVLTIELITSIIYYIIGDVLIIESFWSLLMTFMYHQLTVTLVLLIIFCPKFYYIKNAPRYSPAKPSSMESNELNIKVTNTNDTEGELKKAYDEIDELKAKLSTYEAKNSESKARSPPSNKQPLERPVVSPRNKPNWQRKDVSSEHEVQPLNEDVAKPKVEPSPRRKSITRHTAM
ncbi:GPR158 [Bugula neritina]|uniref:GPR158 n=1 Tax=Bugula neritina TaxID=10212 RepID=A0A7J7JS85_BUGNE|nr:GPR158 [Bugula neritina]